MRTLVKRLIGPIVKKVHASWLKKPRLYSYKDVSVWVAPGVFPPFVTFSTKFLLEFCETLPLHGKSFLELGCGCGIVSILAAKNGAFVTATDISDVALEMLSRNASDNNISIEILHSDLFDKLQNRKFDYIFINPPYYPKKPQTVAENAWFCGEDFEYFRSLFNQLPNTAENVFMILSEDCEIEKIKAIALENAIAFELVIERKVAAERNFIFRLASL
ncbi:MAG: methyltransferase domain-containing protein [Flavobacterium sp.]|nr:MAG: methyltransferase domain-containing protein [Flavobacterium sp.]